MPSSQAEARNASTNRLRVMAHWIYGVRRQLGSEPRLLMRVWPVPLALITKMPPPLRRDGTELLIDQRQ